MPLDFILPAFGITAAILLVGGAILLRYQRDRYHFLLMQAALDKGITAFPGMVPGWLISLRVGVLALVLGLGLIAAGLVLYRTASDITEPPTMVLPQGRPATTNPGEAPRGPFGPAGAQGGAGSGRFGMEGPGGRGDGFRGPPQGREFPEGRGPGGPGAPGGMGGPGGPGGGRGGEPGGRFGMMSPALERWHRVEAQRIIGLISLCTGGILALLGIVRIAFARIERKYSTDTPATTGT